MKGYQDRAVWELRRQGLHTVAADAEAAWQRGEAFHPTASSPIAREIMEMIRIANWELSSAAA